MATVKSDIRPLLIESYHGSDTKIEAEAFDDTGYAYQHELWAAVVVNPDGTLAIVDNGYRSKEELEEAWNLNE